MARKTKGRRRDGVISVRHSRPRVKSDEAPLQVFVSSAIKGLEIERQAVKDAINRLEPFTSAWIFEETPASDEDVDKYYLDRVRSSALLVLLIDIHDRDAVRKEYQVARDAKVPVLAFVRRVNRPDEFQAWVDRIRSKRADYDTVADLPDLVYISVTEWILRHLRSAIQRGQEENLIQSVVPMTPPSRLREIMSGLIVGLESHADLIPIFRLCSGVPLDSDQMDDELFDSIYFNDFTEMTEVMAAWGRVVNSANQSPGDSRALFRALNEEAARQATQYGLRKSGRRSTPEPKVIPGIRYTIMLIRKDWAEIIRLLRVRDVVEGPIMEVRKGTELYFRYPEVFQHLGKFIEVAEKDQPDDPWALVFEQVNVLIARLQADELMDAEQAKEGEVSNEPLAKQIEASSATAERLLQDATDRLQSARLLNETHRDLKIRALAIVSSIEAAAEAKGRFYSPYRNRFRKPVVLDSCMRVRSALDDKSENWDSAVANMAHALASLLGDESVERRIVSIPRTGDRARLVITDMLLTLGTWLDKTSDEIKFNDIVEGE